MFTQALISGSIEVRLALNEHEICEIQKLRFRTFYEEFPERLSSPEALRERRDFDHIDPLCDHLIAIDRETQEVVGGYRLVSKEVASQTGGFLTAQEFNIACLETYPGKILELGKACVDHRYRTKRVMAVLWQGIEAYIRANQVDLLFGCANFSGADPKKFSQALSFLHYFYLAPEAYRPTALASSRTLAGSRVEMAQLEQKDVNMRLAFRQLPPLIRGYLRLGGGVGDGVFLDQTFNSLDVCIVLESKKLAHRYLRHYGRQSL